MTRTYVCSALAVIVAALLPIAAGGVGSPARARKTVVSIVGEDFHINGRPTYSGRQWSGHRIEGLLFNSRMVQGIFDDRNPGTAGRWAYPDAGRWDAGRNTREFVGAMADWRAHGLLAFTINLQGGSPEGYSRAQPWHNSAINADGSLDPASMTRLEAILDRADAVGMAVILGYFYFGQDERLADEGAVARAVDNATRWVLERGYRHVLMSVDGRRLLAGTSYGGGTIPGETVARVSDFLLLHGNGVSDQARIGQMVRTARGLVAGMPQPIVFNEDDHFDFDKPTNNFRAAVAEHASWGYFDFRMKGEGVDEGFQSVPVNWRIRSARKRGFFELLSAITGESPGSGDR